MSPSKILVISPCRDEARFLNRMIRSMAEQTRKPDLWIIVDDGSTDDSADILEKGARELDWMRIVRRQDRGSRKVGSGVVEALYAALQQAAIHDYDWICKLDVDLVLEKTFFSSLFEKMKADSRLGICSGRPWNEQSDGSLLPEKGFGKEMAVGAGKFYRRTCFEQIGGFVRQVMWDGIDCHRARMLGWKVRSFDEPDLRFTHLRPMGSSHKGIFTGRARHGFGQYFMGTGPLYMAASVANRLFEPPVGAGALAMGWGYLRSALKGEKRYEDPEFRAFLRRFQNLCLFKGKAKAVEIIEAEMAGRWNPDRPADPALASELEKQRE